ncbi:hypothetical protein B0O99DRAFT_198695 [Bisporella sp. PMI_857]|nr:hypothetical protein B0O99DRAFT_198695 [Bisporella sp. PMI_857]
MPMYNALGTAVKLRAWDPAKPWSNYTSENRGEMLQEETFELRLARLRSLARQPIQTGPAKGCIYEDLREEAFGDSAQLRFFDDTMPFFLVKVGRDLLLPRPHQSLPRSQVHDGSPDSGDLSGMPTSLLSGGSSPVSAQLSAKMKHKILDPNEFIKPITKPTPIQVVVDLSPKSLMPSLVSFKPQDICVTIYLNGELTQCRLIRPRNNATLIRKDGFDESQHQYSGRRVDTGVELPWAINPVSLPVTVGEETRGTKYASLEERWFAVNSLLSQEIELWENYGSPPSPMRSYLENLSKLSVPESKCRHDELGAKAGIIDVIITLGRVGKSRHKKALDQPGRKLPESFCGIGHVWTVAPQETKQKKSSALNAAGLGKTSGASKESPSYSNNAELTDVTEKSRAETKNVHQLSMVTQVTIDSRQFEEPMLWERSTAGTHSYPPAREYLLQGVVDSGKKSGFHPMHPKGPRSIPRKRYRGAENSKKLDEFSKGGFDLAPYMATRSRLFQIDSNVPTREIIHSQLPSNQNQSSDRAHTKVSTVRSVSQAETKIETAQNIRGIASPIQGVHERNIAQIEFEGRNWHSNIEESEDSSSMVMNRNILATAEKHKMAPHPTTRITFSTKYSKYSTLVDRHKFSSLNLQETPENTKGGIKGPSRSLPKRLRAESNLPSINSDQSEEQPVKRKRPTHRSMSARELGALFEPHRAYMGVDESLGTSFREDGRSLRRASTRDPFIISGRGDQSMLRELMTTPNAQHENQPSTINSNHMTMPDNIRNEILAPIPHEKKSVNKLVSHASHDACASNPISYFLDITPRRYNQTAEGSNTPLSKDGLKMTKASSSRPTRALTTNGTITVSKPRQARSSLSNPGHRLPSPSRLSGEAESTIIVSPAVEPECGGHSSLARLMPSKSSESLGPTAGTPGNAFATRNLESPREWKPNSLCDDSVVGYLHTPDWPDTELDPTAGRPVRAIRQEREGVFRASGVLMGVRFVVGI